jgi:hypothetical protein
MMDWRPLSAYTRVGSTRGKTHIILRSDCPRHNGYVTWDPHRDRDIITIHPKDLRLARSMMEPARWGGERPLR